jgi:hypothetical protein
LLELGVEDPSTGHCLVEAVKKLHFVPAPHKRVDLDLKIGLFPGDAPLPSVHTLNGEENQPDTGFDPERSHAALEASRGNITRCYEQGLERMPGLWGRLELRVTLNETGKLVSLAEGESRFPDAAVRACVEDVVSKVLFPAPKATTCQAVVAFRFGQAFEPKPAAR